MADEVFAMVPLSLIGTPVGHRAFRVLVGLLAHADREGLCHPSNNRLADVTGLDRRNVVAAIRELSGAGTIEVHAQGRDRVIRVVRGVKATPSDSGKSGVKTTPALVSKQHHGSVKVTPSDTCKGSVKTITPLVSKQHPALEQTREQTIPLPPLGGDSVKVTPPDTADLAGRVVAEVFGLGDSAGVPDWDAAGMVRQWIAGYSERAVLAAAHEARRRAKGDPLRFFVGMCRNGLDEPTTPPGPKPATPRSGPANSTADADLTPFQRRQRALSEGFARRKAERAAQKAAEENNQ